MVTIGAEHAPREKIFMAVIDQVDVKKIKDLSQREIELDHPELRRIEDSVKFLEQIYSRAIEPEDTVTFVRFSEIVERQPDIAARLRGESPFQN